MILKCTSISLSFCIHVYVVSTTRKIFPPGYSFGNFLFPLQKYKQYSCSFFFLFFSLSKKKSCAAHVSTNICDVMHVSDWYNHVFLPLWLSIFFFLRFGYGNESYDYCVCNVVLSFPLPFVALVGFFLFSIYLFLRQFEGKVKSA